MSLSFDEAVYFLKGKDSKKLENNTYLVRVDAESVGIKLHETIVVYIYKSGNYQYDTGGWRSTTTKDRINKYGPVKVSQKNGVWYIGTGIYEDGVMLTNEGEPIHPLRDPDRVERKKRKLDKMVREYVKGFAEFAKHNGLATGEDQKESEWKVIQLSERQPLKPSGGDCWHCWLGVTQNANEPSVFGDSHLLSHLSEKYYVPSLLYKAIVTAGYRDPSFIWHEVAAEVANRNSRLLENILNKFFTKKKPALLELLDSERVVQ
jgi:hypothetical protein